MAITPTNLPVPSESPRDLKSNVGKIDEFVTSMGWTYTDRFGNQHYTIEGFKLFPSSGKSLWTASRTGIRLRCQTRFFILKPLVSITVGMALYQKSFLPTLPLKLQVTLV